MHIYATGMNPADCNSLKRRPRVAIFQAFVELMNAVQRTGDKVTWKITKVGEPLPDDVDAVITSMLLPRSLNCPYALGVMWTISEALRRQIPLVLYLTDWAFFSATQEYRSIHRAGVEYFSKTIGGALQYNESPEMIERYGEDLISVCQQYHAPDSDLWAHAQILIPKFTNWGDSFIVEKLLPSQKRVFPMDPTPALLQYLEGGGLTWSSAYTHREKSWLWPSLLTDERWIDLQQLTWPVDHFGPKKFPVAESERSVQLLYREQAGALCPPYPTAGSGWWRSRWIHAAMAGSVLLCDTGDDKVAGEEYGFSGSDYEGMTDVRRSEVAVDQQIRMYDLLQKDPKVMVEQIYAPFAEFGL